MFALSEFVKCHRRMDFIHTIAALACAYRTVLVQIRGFRELLPWVS